MKGFVEEDGLSWVGGEASAAVPQDAGRRPGRVVLFGWAFGVLGMVIGLADRVAQMWGR